MMPPTESGGVPPLSKSSEPLCALPLSTSLRAFVSAQLWLTGIAVVYSLLARWFMRHDPFVWPVQRGWLFSDFFSYRPLLPYMHTARFFTQPGVPFLHPATAIPMYVIFSFHHALRVFLLICLGLWAFAAIMFWRKLRLRGIGAKNATAICLTAAVCSYPFAFSLQRGNFEILIALGAALGTWDFMASRYNRAAILWGFFGCIKLYPLLLLVMFIPYKRFKQLGLGLLTAAASMLFALWYTGPTTIEAYRLSSAAVQRFVQLYPYNPDIQGYEHSFFGLTKLLLYPFHPNPDLVWRILSPSLAILMLVLYFWKVIRLPATNQLLFLTIGMITLPPCSFDYTLLHLYAPWALLVLLAIDTAKKGQHVPGLTATMVLLAAVMTPQNYMHHNWLLFQGGLKSLLLAALLFIAVKWPLIAEEEPAAPSRVRETSFGNGLEAYAYSAALKGRDI